MKSKYIIGTRGSLLAVTQSTLIKNQLEELTGFEFEIKTIKTTGDLVQDKPLWQIDGKDFFTKELDSALLAGEVDLVIHSYKDLGSIRPEGITLGAITHRAFAHDILFFNPKSLSKKEVTIGTSSPRRIYNLEKKLADFMPRPIEKVTCQNLRGNVNSRLEKIAKGEFDGVVLALAGLERLCSKKESLDAISQNVNSYLFSILPLSVFPTAAAQGALALEYCPEHNPQLKNILNVVHCDSTALEVAREKKSFAQYGGGCHLAVGISAQNTAFGLLEHHQGSFDNKDIDTIVRHWEITPPASQSKWFVGLPVDKNPFSSAFADHLIEKKDTARKTDSSNVFVTSPYCLSSLTSHKCIWASGARTWKKLSDRSFWVNGSADSLGMSQLIKFQKSHFFQNLIHKHDEMVVLSEENASNEPFKTFASYSRMIHHHLVDQIKNDILAIDCFYWTSYPQYAIYKEFFPEIQSKRHFCGLGKTLDEFKKNNIHVTPIFGMDDLKKWIGIK